MLVGVADTHTLLWYLHADPRLSSAARAFLDTAAEKGDQVGISSITLIEMGRIATESFTQLANVLKIQDGLFREIPLDLQVARALSRINAASVPDMPDRIIAATALLLQVPAISRDSKLRASGLATIW